MKPAAQKRPGADPSERFEVWYAPKLAALAAVLDDDRNARYVAEMEQIARRPTVSLVVGVNDRTR